MSNVTEVQFKKDNVASILSTLAETKPEHIVVIAYDHDGVYIVYNSHKITRSQFIGSLEILKYEILIGE
jgi:hypothetical protein